MTAAGMYVHGVVDEVAASASTGAREGHLAALKS